MTMSPRDGVAAGVDLIARHYPNFAPASTGQLRGLHDDYVAELHWADGETILAGFRIALKESTQFAPRFSLIVACVTRAAKYRAGGTIQLPAEDPDAICVRCGTRSLIDEPDPYLRHPDPKQRRDVPRMYPLHAHDCPLARSAA